MNYYKIDTAGNLDDRSLCILGKWPEGIGIKNYYLMKGLKLDKHFPLNANYFMDDRNPGMRLCHFIGNLVSILIFSSEVLKLINETCTNEIEYLAFTLYNHKKRIASKDYSIVNPIGTFDCLNEKATNIKYTPLGEPFEPETYVLDPTKMENAPHLFRIKDFPYTYVLDSDLADKIRAKKFPESNIVVSKLEQIPTA